MLSSKRTRLKMIRAEKKGSLVESVQVYTFNVHIQTHTHTHSDTQTLINCIPRQPTVNWLRHGLTCEIYLISPGDVEKRRISRCCCYCYESGTFLPRFDNFTESKRFTARFNITLTESNVSLLEKESSAHRRRKDCLFFHPLKVISLVRI